MSTEIKPHQSYIEIKKLVQNMIATMTNDSYAQGDKVAYKLTWEKGTEELENNLGKKTKNYYTLRINAMDKRHSTVGTLVPLYANHYALEGVTNLFKLEELAYKELLLNSMRSLINVQLAIYYRSKENQAVKEKETAADSRWAEIKASIENKPKLFIP